MEDRNIRLDKEIKDSFALIGRFVQEFELMVNAARAGCICLISSGVMQQRLVSIAFQHQSMTAQPLFDIWRAIVAEFRTINGTETNSIQDIDENRTLNYIISHIGKEYSHLVHKRNTISHGTWYIGWVHPEREDFSDMPVEKGKVTKGGLEFACALKDKEELLQYIQRCNSTAQMINRATGVIRLNRKFKNNFIQQDGAWRSRDDPAK